LKPRQFIPVLIIAAGVWAYHNSFQGQFVFDDVESIAENPHIRHLWPVWEALKQPPKGGTTVAGRPIVGLSLAINYAISGLRVRGYHTLNLAIHVAAGLVLFGIARRTLLQPPLRQRFGMAALPLALVIALIWVVHPLQTESVTYVAQRAESMMGLFHLLTLYCVIRGAESDSPNIWYTLSVTSCLLGMASKEVMVSAPLIVLLYDRTFLCGSFAEAWRRRARLYLGLAATWMLLGHLMLSTGNRSGSVGLGTGLAWQPYALTQLQAILHYLHLSIWPHPLVFDYGSVLANGADEILPGALIVLGMLAGTVVAIRRWPSVGFLGAWFFAILAPTSSVLPVASQTIAEHRMYLPLAAVVAAVVLGAFDIGKRLFNKQPGVVLGCVASGFAVVLFTSLTIQRNRDYTSALAIWQDTVEKCPNNARAQLNLGDALLKTGKPQDAIGHLEQALRIKHDLPMAHNDLGMGLVQLGRLQEGIGHYEQALRVKPDDARAHYNWANALLQAGRVQEAISHYEQALRIEPDFATAHINLGDIYFGEGKVREAIGHYEQALQVAPDYAAAHNNLAVVLMGQGRLQEAIGHYEQAVRLQPDFAEAHYNLAVALERAGRVQEAISHDEQALRLKPDYAAAHNNLAVVLMGQGRLPEAIGHYEQALRFKPDDAEAQDSLGIALVQLGRVQEAISHYEQALRLKPDDARVHSNLALALVRLGRLPEAVEQWKQSLQIKPGDAGVHNNLGIALVQLGKLPEAVEQWEQALRIDPDFADVHYNLGVALEQTGRVQEAIGHYEQALRIKPDFVQAQNALARARAAQ
jgi:tetratricopeptide (TPR) repeat protein